MLQAHQSQRSNVNRSAKPCSPRRARCGSPASAPPSSRATGREREAGNVFRTLVKEGTAVESRAIRIVGDRVEALDRRRANALWKQTRAHGRATVRRLRRHRGRRSCATTLPKALPSVELPAMLRAAPSREDARAKPREDRQGARREDREAREARREARERRYVTLRYHRAPNGSRRSGARDSTPMRSTHAGAATRRRARAPARRRARADAATRAAASASRSPAAVRSAASTKSARCSRSPTRSTASTSTTSTSTSACRPAASSPPRSRTASRRRRCTGCSSTTAPTPR